MLHILRHDLPVYFLLTSEDFPVLRIQVLLLLPELAQISSILLDAVKHQGREVPVRVCHLNAACQLVGDDLCHRIGAPAVDVDRVPVKIPVGPAGRALSLRSIVESNFTSQSSADLFRRPDIRFRHAGSGGALFQLRHIDRRRLSGFFASIDNFRARCYGRIRIEGTRTLNRT